MKNIKTFVRTEAAFLFGVVTTVLFYRFSYILLADLLPDLMTVTLFLWLFATMLWCASVWCTMPILSRSGWENPMER
jgi:hypothetical protein